MQGVKTVDWFYICVMFSVKINDKYSFNFVIGCLMSFWLPDAIISTYVIQKIVGEGDPTPAGYQLFMAQGGLAVPSSWLSSTLGELQKKDPIFVVKKLIDGLPGPADYGIEGGLGALWAKNLDSTNHEIP